MCGCSASRAEFPDRLGEVSPAHDRVPEVDRFRLVASELHGPAARDTCALEVPHGTAAKIVWDSAGDAGEFARPVPRTAEHIQLPPVGTREHPRDHSAEVWCGWLMPVAWGVVGERRVESTHWAVPRRHHAPPPPERRKMAPHGAFRESRARAKPATDTATLRTRNALRGGTMGRRSW
jgi:hypothetical protein